MGFVEANYTSILNFLNELGGTQFASVAGQIAVSAQILCVIVVILVLINMSLQAIPMSGGPVLVLLIKIVLIALFLQSWAQFNSLFLAVDSLFTGVSNRMLAASLGDGTDTTNFARELDNLGSTTSRFANVTAGRLNILGGFINGIMYVLMAILGAISLLALVVSRVVLTVLIAVAPLAIFATLTSPTKSYFESWLSAVITMFIFPLVLAGVFAVILSLANNTISGIEADEVTTIGKTLPIMQVIVLSIILVLTTPFVVQLVSGSIQLGNLVSGAGSLAARGSMAGAKGAFSGAGGLINGAKGGDAGQSAGKAARAGAAIGGGLRTAASAMSPSNFGDNLKGGINQRAGQLNRVSERVERFRGK
jgi:type IV secretion system protein VirB6